MNMKTDNIQFNADDFGISEAQSAHIVEANRNGAINATSLLVNSPLLERTLPLLSQTVQPLRIAVHLNVTEGKSLETGLRLLTDRNGLFCRSFAQLALLSLTKRRLLKEELKRELGAQVQRGMALIPGLPLRLDGHQHVQMLPLVMRCICELVDERGWHVEYIRNTAEPLAPYLRHPELWGRVRPVNWVKNFVLNVLAVFDINYFKRLGLRRGCVFGLVLSGDMTYEPVSVLLPDFARWAEKRGRQLELVMHPGWGLMARECMDPSKPGFVAFCTSPKRKEEADCASCLQN